MFAPETPALLLPEGSAMLRGLFIALSALIGAAFVAAVYVSAVRSGVSSTGARVQGMRAAAGVTLWMSVTGALAATGALHFSSPPTMLPVFPALIALAIGIALSPLGRRIAIALPVSVLVGFQSFRIVVELLLHRAYTEGLMPVQMSYSGRNMDIVTGITAVIVGLWLTREPASPRLMFAWNTLGVVLLLNILVVALLSAPTPMRVFMNEPSNVWVTRAPWIWLPTVMVLAAIMGHVLVYRRLWLERARARQISSASLPSHLEPVQ